MGVLSLNRANVSLADEVPATSIQSVITSKDGTFDLTKNGAYSYTQTLAFGADKTFSGTINGNGATIVFEGTERVVPLFDNLFNANITNLTLKLSESCSIDLTQNSNFGLLAGATVNSSIKGVQIANSVFTIYENPEQITHAEVNIGLLFGDVTGGTIDQVKIQNCSVSPTTYTENDITKNYAIRSNSNFGLLAGKVSGTRLQNILITQNSVSALLSAPQSKSHNVGAIVGLMGAGYITNSIVDFANNTTTITTKTKSVTNDQVFYLDFEGSGKYVNFGYVAGKTTVSPLYVYNIVVNCVYKNASYTTDKQPLKLSDDNIYTGVLFGQMHDQISNEYLHGVLTTASANFVGNIPNATFTSTYQNINVASREEQISSNLANASLWHDAPCWNFDTVWHITNQIIPSLQYFEQYAVSFSSLESVKSLVMENVPTLPNNQDIVASTLSASSVEYGNNLTIEATITNQQHFDQFFYITGLNLNGKTIFDIKTGKSLSGFKVSCNEVADKPSSVVFTVENFNATNQGVFSVQLARNTFKLKIQTYELTVDDQPFIPGKIKSNMATEASESLIVEMEYGKNYTYETYDVNSDYAKEADWYLTHLSTESDEQFSLDATPVPQTSFVASRTLSWTFNENCELFKQDANDLNNYLDFDEYSEDNIFAIYVVFTRDVKDVEIRFKLDNDTNITEKIAEVLIDNGSVSVTFKDGVYYAKVRYGSKPHTITLRQLSTTYFFDEWRMNARLDGVVNDEYAGQFTVSQEGDGVVEITAYFSTDDKTSSTNLLWLWITLGGVALAGIVVVIVIAIKRKSTEPSYKKYWY